MLGRTRGKIDNWEKKSTQTAGVKFIMLALTLELSHEESLSLFVLGLRCYSITVTQFHTWVVVVAVLYL